MSDHRVGTVWLWAVQVAIPGVLATAAYVLQVQLGEQLSNWLHWTLLGAGGVSTLATLLMPGRIAIDEWKRREEAESLTQDIQAAVASYRLKINDGLRSFVGLLDQIIQAKLAERRELQGSMIQATMNFASVRLGDGHRTRACYFRYDPGPPRRLLCVGQYTGRHDEPRKQFVAGEPPGDYTFKILDGPGAILHPEETGHARPALRGTAQYNTFIVAKVASGNTLFGMLCVDSTEIGDLTAQDKIFVTIIAQILGSALAIGRRQNNSAASNR